MNDIAINLWDIILYIVVALVIWNVLDEQYKDELGAVAGFLLELAWFILWLILFVIVDFDLQITLN